MANTTNKEVSNPAIWGAPYSRSHMGENKSDMGDVGNPYESSDDGSPSPGTDKPLPSGRGK